MAPVHTGNLRWFKSSYSGGSGSDCVEIAVLGEAAAGSVDGVAVRDSKNPTGPHLTFSRAGFAALIDSMRTDAP
ncbi:DUF397 domain-containing protein [Streptomyces sp. NBC_00134]|uniref:DUF397 domain-containing protein n=1 Tax=Streptomyces sp. NBC_00134 TaxID=2975663 RepID=UPI002F9145BC